MLTEHLMRVTCVHDYSVKYQYQISSRLVLPLNVCLLGHSVLISIKTSGRGENTPFPRLEHVSLQ